MVSIPACHAGDRGSIPRRGAFFRKKVPNLKLVERVMFSAVRHVFQFNNLPVGRTLKHTYTTMNIISNILSSILDIEFRVLRRGFQKLKACNSSLKS